MGDKAGPGRDPEVRKELLALAMAWHSWRWPGNLLGWEWMPRRCEY